MRTTLTLDDDVAAELEAAARRAGKPFRDVVNETLRRGLESQRVTSRRQPFKVETRDLGELKPGLSLDNVAELIEQVEGSAFVGGRPYQAPARPMGLRPGVDLTHALRLAASLEDEEIVRKLALRK